ncbi:hypothetical protein BH23THE1_BH23THE1_25930 [soil metagenome]
MRNILEKLIAKYKVKIFFMTAFDTADLKDNEDFKKAIIDWLLQKPVHFADLREMVNKVWKLELRL